MKKIVIIGAGLTGLAAGIYGKKQGYETAIFEKHSLPGGVCTVWKRKGFTFDGAFHWWLGSIPDSPMYSLFEDVGIFPGTKAIQRDTFVTLKLEGGEEFTVYTRSEKLKEEMLRIAPEDRYEIDRLFEDVSRMDWGMAVPDIPMDALSFPQLIGFLFKNRKPIRAMQANMNITIGEYSRRFSNQNLRDAINRIFAPSFPVFILLSTLSAFDSGDGNFPRGGAAEFVAKIEKYYRELGGSISYSSGVKKIIIENSKAVGILLENGEEHRGDWILSAADGHSTIFDMLGGRFISKNIMNWYGRHKVFDPVVQVSFGVNADLSHYPHCIGLPEITAEKGMKPGGAWLRHYCYDPTLAPKGKSVVTALVGTEYEVWKDLDRSGDEYKELKEAYAKAVLEAATAVYPDMKGNIEVTDVATPLTLIRYTGNWRASFEGWLPVRENLIKKVPKTLPGLKNFRMAGQWTEPGGGIPTAVSSGRTAVYMFCKADKICWKEPGGA